MLKGNILRKIESIKVMLPGSELKVADFISKYPEKVVGMTTKDLSDAANCSQASIIRFCKRLQVSSFTDLKVMLGQEVISDIPVVYSDILPNENITDTKIKLLGNAIQSMQSTIEQINDEVIKDVVELIDDSELILVYGVGASFLVAENINQKFSRLGKTVINSLDIHMLITLLTSNKKKMLLICISNSGDTKEVISLVKQAKKNKVPTIGICQFGKNLLSINADYVVNTFDSSEINLRSAATSSLHTQFIVIDILFSAYFIKNFDYNKATIYRSRKLVEKYKNDL